MSGDNMGGFTAKCKDLGIPFKDRLPLDSPVQRRLLSEVVVSKWEAINITKVQFVTMKPRQ